ncbi:MAG: hypothetical protein Q7V56_16920 [Gammaproteobacteria bacterium]|nr:hypothetical protein [Gammaproteobacteria bacterium]
MNDILVLRFQARDTAFELQLKSIKQDAAARNSFGGNMILKGHEALVAELVESRKLIANTLFENLQITHPKKVSSAITEVAVAQLRERQKFLERFYLEKMNPVLKGLQNKKALEPHLDLSSVIDLNEQELRVELARKINEYIHSQGETLYHRIRNQFLNRPLVVIGVIVFATTMAVLAFVSAVLTWR